MSVVDQLKNLFAKKKSRDGAGETSGDLSLGSPEASMDPVIQNEVTAAMGLPEGDSVDGPESIDGIEQVSEA